MAKKNESNNIVVVKLGGSLVSPSEYTPVDFDYLTKLLSLFNNYISAGRKFAVVVGGGRLCRNYQNLLTNQGKNDPEDLHWVGIAATNLNAEMVRAFWGNICEKKIIRYEDYYEKAELKFEKDILIGCGSRPHFSTDLACILLANRIGAKTIICLKDVDGVYQEDPKVCPNAEKCAQLSWNDYSSIIGKKKQHDPGGNLPVDPVASAAAQKDGIVFKVMSGKDMESVKNAIEGREFNGTTIA